MSIYRSPFWNFTIALLCGIALGAAGAVHICANRTQHHIDEISQTIARIQANNDRSAAAAKEIEKNTAEIYAGSMTAIAEWRSRAESCEAAATALQADARDRAFRDQWYTLVYEPGAPAGPSPLELLNLARPGLGTLLAHAAAQNAPPGLQLRYVLPGIVDPLSAPAGTHFVRTLTAPTAVQ
jgi:hypothetical protein